jgi:hypothetical protein
METYVHTELHQGRMNYDELIRVMELVLPANIGSNEFQTELENFALHNYDDSNLQTVTDLVKALSLYEVKNQELLQVIYSTVERKTEDFSIN